MSAGELALVSPLDLRPTEETSPDRVREVIAMIVAQQAWTVPICIERTTYAVLDGHHRHAAAIQLGLSRVPVSLFDYGSVELDSWRPEILPTREEVLRRALARELYPQKTTRHTFLHDFSRTFPIRILLFT